MLKNLGCKVVNVSAIEIGVYLWNTSFNARIQKKLIFWLFLKTQIFLCTIIKTNLQRAIKNLSKNIAVFWSTDKVQYFCLYASAWEYSPMSYYFYHRQQKDVTVLSFCKNSSVFLKESKSWKSCKKLFSAPQFKPAIQTLKESNPRLLLFCSGDTIWSKQYVRIWLSFSHHTLASFPFALNL